MTVETMKTFSGWLESHGLKYIDLTPDETDVLEGQYSVYVNDFLCERDAQSLR